jgi:biotin carboxyl carrier protein
MKMENELCAETDGTVKEILVEPGLNVDSGAALVRLEPSGPTAP